MVEKSQAAGTGSASVDTPRMDYGEHVRTFNGFAHLLKWFTIHVAVLLLGLYFMVIVDDPVTGMTVVVLAVAVFIWGVLRIPEVERDAVAALKPPEDSDPSRQTDADRLATEPERENTHVRKSR